MSAATPASDPIDNSLLQHHRRSPQPRRTRITAAPTSASVDPTNLATYPEYEPAASRRLSLSKFDRGRCRSSHQVGHAQCRLGLAGGAELYFTASYGDKNAASLRELPNCPRDQLHGSGHRYHRLSVPFGFDPEEATHEVDYQGTVGIKGTTMDWNWDMASSLRPGPCRTSTRSTRNAATPSLSMRCRPCRTSTTAILQATQWTNTIDVNKRLRCRPRGAAERRIRRRVPLRDLQIGAGIPESYLSGGASPIRDLRPPTPAATTARTMPVYIDLATKPIENLRVDVAGRYEHYSDFGSADGRQD